MAGERLQTYPDRFCSVGAWNVSVRDETSLILFVLHLQPRETAAIPKRPT